MTTSSTFSPRLLLIHVQLQLSFLPLEVYTNLVFRYSLQYHYTPSHKIHALISLFYTIIKLS